MKMILRIAAMTACVLASAGAAAQDQAMSGEQIRAAWTGKKLFARSATAGLLDLHLRADGTAQVAVGNMSDSGTWRTTDTGYCAKWQRIRKGEEACFQVVKRGDKTLTLNADGSVASEILRVVD